MAESTHQVRLGGTTVVKAYALRHGDEAEREWGHLVLLGRWAPGSAPRPVSREVLDGTVRIAMGRVPGVPLAGASLTGSPPAGRPRGTAPDAYGRAGRRARDAAAG